MGYLRTNRDPATSTQAKSTCYPPPGMNLHLRETYSRERGGIGIVSYIDEYFIYYNELIVSHLQNCIGAMNFAPG